MARSHQWGLKAARIAVLGSAIGAWTLISGCGLVSEPSTSPESGVLPRADSTVDGAPETAPGLTALVSSSTDVSTEGIPDAPEVSVSPALPTAGSSSETGAAEEAESTEQSRPSGTLPDAFPEVTFPEASIRDTEAEAADRERRRSVIGLFEQLRVEAEHRGGYDRDVLFAGWLYRGGLSTRDWVLTEERMADGTWFSAYDAVVVANASELDIDHLVPLAEAWESGGHTWSAETWTRFANDRDDPRSLIAVSASANRGKGARDPADWWPSQASYRCQYAADWVAVKSRWRLSVDSAEHRSLAAQLERCAGAELAYVAPEPARVVESAVVASTEPVDTQSDVTGQCHPAYEPCIPNLSGDALNCGDLSSSQKPVTVRVPGVDPYRLDRDGDGSACESS